MHCPFCNYDDTKVVDSRLTADNLQVRRRRECLRCNSRFSTYETIELNLPRVVKKDNAREAFNLDKLKKGFYLALEKRPIASDLIEKSIDNIVKNIRSSVEKEIDSKKFGIMVMQELRKLDQVAYIRFASVYYSFEDLQAFLDVIETVEKDLTPEMNKAQMKLIEENK